VILLRLMQLVHMVVIGINGKCIDIVLLYVYFHTQCFISLCRYVALNESTLIYENSVKGHATGELTSTVPESGTNGVVTLHSDVYNGNMGYVFHSEGEALWYTNSEWTKEGMLSAKSVAMAYGSPYNWNASGTMNYGENQYQLIVYENNYGVAANASNIVNNQMYLVGTGGYGGSSWYNW